MLPSLAVTGIVSPVTRLWSISRASCTTTPSTAIRSPGRTRTRSPGLIAATGTSDEFMRADEFGRGLGAQRRHVAGDSAGFPPHDLLERAPDQQEGEQHQGGIEIGVFGVIERLDNRHAERKQNADGDRHVHVEAARFDGADRRMEERPARIGGGRQRDQRREPVEEIALLRRDVGHVARPHRNRKQHDVHRGEGGDAEAAQQHLPFTPSRRSPICRNRTDGRGSRARRGDRSSRRDRACRRATPPRRGGR